MHWRLEKYIMLHRLTLTSLFIGALCLTLTLGLACGSGNGSQPNRGGGSRNLISVEAVLVKPQLLLNTIFTTGTLLANEEVQLHPEISGRVTGVYFQEGKHVRKGELLLKINDTELKAQLRRKQVEEKQASDEEGRRRKLFEIKAISQEEYDKSLNALHMIQAEREAIESQLAETEIRAPFDGIIGLRHVSEGGYVTPSVLIASLQDTDPMKVEFAVPEKYARLLKSGTEVAVRVGESKDARTGKVYAVESMIDPETRTITGRATTPNSDGGLVPGAFAKVEITLERVPDAIVVPSEAVIPDLAGETVFICKNGKAVTMRVTSGIRTETGIQITEGLSPNDTLIVTGILQLTDGKGVQVKTLGNN
ncbi:efflux transporter periplasmic adaptor subunit [candidate division GN15 bacterium]|uniref:Efflux transporter periplasmic adaptor subunit n=1 Tax=candidate division GN15 bacterium TaxID=2072418 RepID=A0A855X690_9BACT|nr:MAG: efflux transporter periplasmic adaptor subunit [candidate division GN15 bacterium]